MWTVLAPLIILVIVLLLGIRNVEKFTTTTTTTSSEVLTRDASGNIVDASGNVVMAAATSQPTISLSLMDLLRVITSTSEQATATAFAATQQQQEQQQTQQAALEAKIPTAAKLYEEIKPELIEDVRTTVRSTLRGSPFMRPEPITSQAGCSDATAQGVEFVSAKASLEDNSEYIRKDSIPCYGCTLPQ